MLGMGTACRAPAVRGLQFSKQCSFDLGLVGIGRCRHSTNQKHHGFIFNRSIFARKKKGCGKYGEYLAPPGMVLFSCKDLRSSQDEVSRRPSQEWWGLLVCFQSVFPAISEDKIQKQLLLGQLQKQVGTIDRTPLEFGKRDIGYCSIRKAPRCN